jgi:hypothetical protein
MNDSTHEVLDFLPEASFLVDNVIKPLEPKQVSTLNGTTVISQPSRIPSLQTVSRPAATGVSEADARLEALPSKLPKVRK